MKNYVIFKLLDYEFERPFLQYVYSECLNDEKIPMWAKIGLDSCFNLDILNKERNKQKIIWRITDNIFKYSIFHNLLKCKSYKERPIISYEKMFDDNFKFIFDDGRFFYIKSGLLSDNLIIEN